MSRWIFVKQSAAAWSPSDLGALVAWYDASDSTTLFDAVSGGTLPADNGTIKRWQDKSGNGFHLVSGDGVTRHAAEQNLLDVVGVSAGQFIEDQSTDAANNVSGLTLCLVVRDDASPTSFKQGLIVRYSNALATLGGGNTSGKYTTGGRRVSTNSFQRIDSSASVALAYTIHIGRFDYANTTMGQYINGSLDGVSTSFQDAGSSAAGSNWITIGGYGAGETRVGKYAEALVVNAAVTTSEREKIEGYLAHKWGLAANLPVGHPYKSAAPTV